jgi:hypothetical protein
MTSEVRGDALNITLSEKLKAVDISFYERSRYQSLALFF